MTTVVYRAGVLACDSRTQSGGWTVSDSMGKIVHRDDGAIATGTGDWELVARFLDCFVRHAEMPDLKDAARGIVAHVDGHIQIFEGAGYFFWSGEFMAWGSGMPPALGALYMGASAADAVAIAALVDPSTGGTVVSMRVADGRMSKNGHVVSTLPDGLVKIEGQAPMSQSAADAFFARQSYPARFPQRIVFKDDDSRYTGGEDDDRALEKDADGGGWHVVPLKS